MTWFLPRRLPRNTRIRFSIACRLMTEKEEILSYLADVENESQEMLKTTESTRQETVAEFRTLYQLLKEQENHLLAQIEEAEKEVARRRDEHLARLSEKVSSLESLIQEMMKKHQQPVNELLQDVKGTLQRYEKREKFENPSGFMFRVKHFFSTMLKNAEAFPSELKRKVHQRHYNSFLKSGMKQFKDCLTWASPQLRADVFLDPATVCSRLVLSRGQKSMKWQRTAPAATYMLQDLFEDPGKCYGFVLGSEGFTAGRHFWEIGVGSEGDWAVGVARKPVKGSFTPEEGIWAVGRWKGQYKAFIRGVDLPLTLKGGAKNIRVCLNYDGGQVAFFDASTAVLLYEFSKASFSGETLHPFFAVYGDGNLYITS